jgi:hypothetical protein
MNTAEQLRKAIEILEDYEQLEAEIIAANELWQPYAKNDALRGSVYDEFIELQSKRNELFTQLKAQPEEDRASIYAWIKEQPEYKNLPVTNSNSLFYHTAPATFAMFILRFIKERNSFSQPQQPINKEGDKIQK